MKFSAARRLLCVLIVASTFVAAPDAKSTTPRYSIDEEKLESSSNLPLETKPLSNPTYLLLQNVGANDNEDVVADATLLPFDRSRSLKYNKKVPVNRAPSSVKTVNSVNTARPKVKYKAKPMIKIPQLNAQSKKGVSVKSGARNKTNSSNLTRKKVNHNIKLHKNGMKTRIKPANKQVEAVSQINPVISTYSPEFPLGGVPSFPVDSSILNNNNNNPLQINPEIYTYSQQNPIQSGATPISQVLLQSVPAANSNFNPADCPSFLISSNVYGPQRQGCSDLNLVVNNYDQIVNPSQALAADPIQADETAAEAPAEVAAAEPAAEAAAPAATSPAGSGGGLPQLPQFPMLPQLGLPDLKGLFDLLGQLGKVLQWIFGLFGFLANPYLYLVPAGISFALGFLKILGAFKIFVLLPALLLFGYVNRDKPPEVAYYNHVHKPIHHDDGWFWNHNKKTWANVAQLVHKKNLRIPKALDLPSVVYKEND